MFRKFTYVIKNKTENTHIFCNQNAQSGDIINIENFRMFWHCKRKYELALMK